MWTRRAETFKHIFFLRATDRSEYQYNAEVKAVSRSLLTIFTVFSTLEISVFRDTCVT